MRQHKLVVIALLLTALAALCGGCGATRPAVVSPPPTVAVPSAPTPAPTPNPAQRATATVQLATEQASPNWQPGLGGMIDDFFLAVLFGRDAKARSYFAPGYYFSVANLAQAFALPTLPDPRFAMGGLGFSTHLIDDSGDRLLVETEVLLPDGSRVRERVTLERDAVYWKITAVVPVG